MHTSPARAQPVILIANPPVGRSGHDAGLAGAALTTRTCRESITDRMHGCAASKCGASTLRISDGRAEHRRPAAKLFRAAGSRQNKCGAEPLHFGKARTSSHSSSQQPGGALWMQSRDLDRNHVAISSSSHHDTYLPHQHNHTSTHPNRNGFHQGHAPAGPG